VAPRGTSAPQALLEMRQKWLARRKRDRDHPSPMGVMVAMAEMVRRMRVGQIHSGMLTAIGLSGSMLVSALQAYP